MNPLLYNEYMQIKMENNNVLNAEMGRLAE
jgi:hypothetical protein